MIDVKHSYLLFLAFLLNRTAFRTAFIKIPNNQWKIFSV